VIEVAAEGSLQRPPGDAGGTTAKSAAAAGRKHLLLHHWLPWLIPLGAIGLPLLGFIVAGSIPDAALKWGEAPRSLGRGDFLIPVLILCLEAMRRWWFDVKCGWRLGTFALLLCTACLGAVVVCLYSFAVAASSPVTSDSIKSVTVITLTSFAAGLASGTIAVAASTPKAGS
jgi:hypothetical protein